MELRRSRRQLGLPPAIPTASPIPSVPLRTASADSLSSINSTGSTTTSTRFFDPMSDNSSTPPLVDPDHDPPLTQTDPVASQLASLSNIITNLQSVIQQLNEDLSASQFETRQARNEIQRLISTTTTNPTNPFETPQHHPTSTNPDFTTSGSSSPPPPSTTKKNSLANFMFQSMKQQEQLLQTFVQTMQNNQTLQTQQFLAVQQDKASTTATFPSFSGKDRQGYVSWETGILKILATHEWSKFYDMSTRDIVHSGLHHPKLSNHLYKSLSLAITDDAQTVMNAKTHLRGNGVALFHALRQTYKSTLSNISLSKKFSELTGGSYFCAQTETIDSYVARTLHRRIREAISKNKFSAAAFAAEARPNCCVWHNT